MEWGQVVPAPALLYPPYLSPAPCASAGPEAFHKNLTINQTALKIRFSSFFMRTLLYTTAVLTQDRGKLPPRLGIDGVTPNGWFTL